MCSPLPDDGASPHSRKWAVATPEAASRGDLQANLAEGEWTDDEAFAAYGLDDCDVAALRAWAMEWADELAP
jgi:hypothetical protein